MIKQKDFPVITGLGIITPQGQGKSDVLKELIAGNSYFSTMKRDGRQKNSSFVGAEIAHPLIPKELPTSTFRTASLSSQLAALVVHEAWQEAKCDEIKPNSIGLIIGGTNLQQRENMLLQEKFAEKPHFIKPYYGLSFMDSDIIGLCTELFNIRGTCFTVGGASASGQIAFIRGVKAIISGEMDVCIVVGAMQDLSFYELYALEALGAMVSSGHPNPKLACRPYDQNRQGFVYGESCAAIILESNLHADKRGISKYAQVLGWDMLCHGNRNPAPSLAAEMQTIQNCLSMAGFNPEQIDYVNPHSTGSLIGDQTEIEALIKCQLTDAYINTTKSITGHGLSAAGAVEIVSTLLQARAQLLHPCLNLEKPVSTFLNLVSNEAIRHIMQNALCLSFGFSGINSSVCFKIIE
tara:strand:+ start:58464 stop:59687 length:1224 start_codon:yes stop_codon:yes gene_type:complete